MGQAHVKGACAWWLAVQALSESGAAEDGPLFPTTEGKPCSRLQLAASWQKEINGEMTGHSGRRSGAMMYARSGLQLFDIAFLGRWKSSAVMRYIEEAMELLAINQRAVGNPQANRMPGGCWLYKGRRTSSRYQPTECEDEDERRRSILRMPVNQKGWKRQSLWWRSTSPDRSRTTMDRTRNCGPYRDQVREGQDTGSTGQAGASRWKTGARHAVGTLQG